MPSVLGPVVIGQDEQTELHVQAVIQSGRRQLDIRLWRRGPTGFAPSRSALTLEAPALDALLEGIAELLEASNGGQQVARVVWDKDEGRRLRAETEPFGTRFTARLRFWQRVRDSWRPTGDGLTLSADQLAPLRVVLERMRPTLLIPDLELPDDGSVALEPSALLRWPAPGADWLTVEPDQLAFHPRGIRITASIEESAEGQHSLVLRQWRREETLWLPRDVALTLFVPDLDTLLQQMRDLADGKRDEACQDIPSVAGSTVRITLPDGEGSRLLRLEERPPPPDDYTFEPRLELPLEYLPRFGRMLAQSGMLLIMHLSGEEREEIQRHQGPEIAPVIVSDAIPPPPCESDEAPDLAADGMMTEPGEDVESIVEPSEEEPAPEPVRRLTPVGNVQLGRHDVFLYLQEEEERHLALQWEGRSFLIPVDSIGAMLAELRDLYYDALRGRRRSVSVAGGEPGVRMSVHNLGSTLAVELAYEGVPDGTRLTFPLGDVPAFLTAGESAIVRIARSGDNSN